MCDGITNELERVMEQVVTPIEGLRKKKRGTSVRIGSTGRTMQRGPEKPRRTSRPDILSGTYEGKGNQNTNSKFQSR